MSVKETVKLNIPVIPKLDKKATANLIRDIRKLEQELSPIKTALKDVTSKANSSVQELRKLSSAVDTTSKRLKRSLDETSTGLKKASKAGSGGRRGGGQKPFKDLEDGADSLEDAFTILHKSLKSQKNTTDKVTKAQERFQKGLKNVKFENFNKRVKHFSEHFPKIFEAGKGGGAGARHAASHGWEALRGPKGLGGRHRAPDANERVPHSTRGSRSGRAAPGGGGGLGAAGGLAVGGILAGVAVIGAFLKILEMASQTQTKLNKAITEGTGTARDFGLSSEQYKNTVDSLRDAIQDTTGTMLKFGGTSEQTAKIINAFTKNATGSIASTSLELTDLGGNLQKGVEELTKTAMSYGRALGVSSEEIAGMIGGFETDLGYSTKGSIDLMGDVVKAAQTSNMPMTKFMGIFHQILPDVEMYQNRLEELTATIKMLSKTMSAKDIQRFEDAFRHGFENVGVKSRIKTAAIVGVPQEQAILKKDNHLKAQAQAKSFEEYKEGSEDIADMFEKAANKGTDAMASFLNTMQGRAAKKEKVLGGAESGEAMKLARFTSSNNKGDLLSVATAMKGASQTATLKTMMAQSQKFVKGFDGFAEVVQENNSIDEKTRDALVSFLHNSKINQDMLKRFGKTNDKYFNKSLREQVMLRKKNMTEKEIDEAMHNASDDEIMAATEASDKMHKDNEKVFDLAKEQWSETESIGNKVDNILGYLLEQILKILNPLLDVANEILNWIMGNDKKTLSALTNIADATKSEITKDAKGQYGYGFSEDDKKHFDAMIDSSAAIIKKGVSEGKTRGELAKDAISGGALDVNKISQERLNKTLQEGGVEKGKAEFFTKRFGEYQKEGDTKSAITELSNAFQDMGGDTAGALMKLVKSQAFGKQWTQASEDKLAGKETTVRPGADLAKKNAGEREAKAQAAITARGIDQSFADNRAYDKNIDEPTSADMVADAKDSAIAAGKVVAAGTPANATPATAPSHPDYVKPKDTLDVAQDSQKQLEQTGKTAEDQLSAEEKDYQATNDLLSLMKKGIKFEQSWMGTKYRNVLKESSLDAFRTALTEFAVLEAKIDTDSALKQRLSGSQGWNFAHEGGALESLLGAEAGKGLDKLHDDNIGGFASGGAVDYDQIAKVHGGEFVVPRGGALVKDSRGGSGGKVVNINGVTINVQTDATAEQIAEAIHNLYKAN